MFSLKNFLMATLLIFALSVGGVAEAGIVTDKVPLQCYVDHKVKSYDKNNGREVGWIDAEVDLVQITGIGGNGVAIGTHPSGSRRVERIFWARDVFEDPGYRNRNVHVNGSHQVFRTKNSGATIGSIANEEVTVVADNGNRAQIIYRLNNGTGYKMGWVPSSIVANNQPVGANFQLSNYNLSNPSEHQLRFTGRVWNANNNSEITGVHVYIGGGVGAGGEFMGEFRSDSNHNFDATLNVPQHRNGNQLIVIYAVNGKDAGELNRTNINVSGGSTSGISDKLQNLINRWNGQRWINHTYSNSSSQCKEFAQYIFNELYGVRTVGSGSTSSNPTNWRLNNTPSSIYKVDEVPETRNATQAREAFRNLFSQAQPGDFIQIKRGHGGPHSAIFVNHTSNGIQWFDANADGKNGIKLQTYSYDDLVKTTNKGYQWNVAMSLYRAR